MNPLRLAIVGATGRMGQALVRLATWNPAFTVAAAVSTSDDPRLGQDAGRVAGLDPLDVAVGVEIAAPCDAVIEFSSPAGAARWAAWCAGRRTPLVSGTTGLDEAQRAALAAAAQVVPVVSAPNMSLGVNLLLALVEDLAARLDDGWDIEIVEAHHRRKVDAPSGTAQALLGAASRGRRRRSADVAIFGRAGAVGARPAGEIGVHALRLGGVVGEHAVHFASEAEELIVAHRAASRETFAAGALRAAQWVQGRAPGLYDMRAVLFT